MVTTNLSLSALPKRLNLHGSGSIIVVAYFDFKRNRYESAKSYELNVNDNGVVSLTPCALAEAVQNTEPDDIVAIKRPQESEQ